MTFDPGSLPFRLRLGIESLSSDSVNGGFTIYLKKNSGSYAPITPSSSGGVKAYDASSDADDTTIRVPRLYPFSSDWKLSGAAIDLDFANGRIHPPGNFTDYLSCSRASIGFAKNSDGTLTQFSTDVLRIGTGIGLSAAEDARINLLPHSQDTTNWSTTFNVTYTNNADVAPDGTTTAMEVKNNTTDTIVQSESPTVTLPADDTYAFSIYAKIKSSANTWCQMVAHQNVVDATITVWFNLTGTGAVGSYSTDSNATFISASIEALANGWYRLTIIGTMTHTQDGGTTAIFVRGDVPSDGSTACTANDTYNLWGAQMERAAFISSYIPTTTTSAARAADVLMPVSTLQTDIAAATGSIVAQVNNGRVASLAANVVDSNGTNLLGFDASNHGLASVTATLATGNTANRTSRDKLGIAWNASGRSLALNGGTVATDASAQTPSSTQHLGSSGSANFTFADIERLTVWTSKILDATLQGHTS